MTPDELRGLIARYGAGTRDFFLAGHPPDLMSPLFNMPARLVVGSHCYYDVERRSASSTVSRPRSGNGRMRSASTP